MNKFLPLLLVAIVLSACSKTTAIRYHKDFQTHISKSQSLIILPATIEAVTVDVGEKKTRNHNYESLVEDVIIDQLREKLSKKGYRTRFLSKREIHNNKLSRNVLSFKEDYNNKITDLYKTILWEEEKANNVNLFLERPAKEIAKISDSNLAIFIEYHLKTRSSGACAKDMTLAILSSALGASSNREPAEFLSVRIAIINLDNGQFIWSNFASAGFGTFSGVFNKSSQALEISRLSEIFDTLLKDFPAKDKLN